MLETWVLSLGWEDPLEKGKATHSNILAWRILQSMGHKESDTTERLWLSLSTIDMIEEIPLKLHFEKISVVVVVRRSFVLSSVLNPLIYIVFNLTVNPILHYH